MSRRGPTIDFNPLLAKVQRDISFLSYLGLHQYAKKQKLIGRSRPMITKDMDFVTQRRLNFRLLVACIQQIVGTTHYTHGARTEQVNYVNVGNYAQLRLYGLLDRDIFALDTAADTTLTGWWPGQLGHSDIEHLGSVLDINAFETQLSHNARATIEVGGPTFMQHMRDALRMIIDEPEITPHSQRDPRNRMKVKNLSLNLQLIETRPYRTESHRHRVQAGVTLGATTTSGFVDVPCHIERLLHFRDTVWPWVQRLSTPEARNAFGYVRKNYPSNQAIQVKIREIRASVQETQRREREAEDAREERERAQEQLRERLVNTYGEPEPQDEDAVQEMIVRDIDNNDDDPPYHTEEDRTGPQIDHVRGYHGRELEAPGAAFDRRLELNQEERARVREELMFANEDEPYRTHVRAHFEDENAEQVLPDTPEFGLIVPNDGLTVLPVPDMHHGMDETIAEQANDITNRLRRALGIVEEED